MVLVVKNLPANAGDIRDTGSIPGSGRSPGGGHGNPLQYSCLKNPMDRGFWQAAVHRVTKRQDWSNLHTHMHTNTERGKGIYYKELPDMIMEAEKSEDMQSKALETENWWCSFQSYTSLSPSSKAGGDAPSGSKTGRRRVNSYSDFCSPQAFTTMDEAHPGWEG